MKSIQSKDQGYLPNLTFVTVNVGEPWKFDKKFDFIHNQFLANLEDNESMSRSTFKNLNPGGWAEFQYVIFANLYLENLPLTPSCSQFIIQIGSTQGLTEKRGRAMKEWNELVKQGWWQSESGNSPGPLELT